MPRIRTVVVALTVCATLPVGSAGASTTATIGPSFSPNRLGARATFTLAIRFTNDQGGVPAPVRRTVLHLPAGLKLDLHGVSVCSKARLSARGPGGCPASSLVGAGSSVVGAHLGSQLISENVTLRAFRGPNQSGRPTLEISGQGLTPLDERVILTGVLAPDRAPYSQQLVMSVPGIPTLPGEPNASPVRFTLTVGAGKGAVSHAHGAVVLPRSCPAGGFPFAADFSFADRSSSSASARIGCP
jgi:hypothetical protein